jgi:hypothetical protein
MRKEIETKILACNNLKEYLQTLQSEFDVLNCTPSGFIKQTIIYQLNNKLTHERVKLAANVNPALLASKNLNEFIEVLLKNYSLENPLQEKTKTDLLKTTGQICALTNLKEKTPPAQLADKKPVNNERTGGEKLIHSLKKLGHKKRK